MLPKRRTAEHGDEHGSAQTCGKARRAGACQQRTSDALSLFVHGDLVHKEQRGIWRPGQRGGNGGGRVAVALAVRLKPLLRRHGCNAAADALLQIIARARGHTPYIFSMLVDGPAVLGVPREWQAV